MDKTTQRKLTVSLQRIRRRCNTKDSEHQRWYKGISVCDEWSGKDGYKNWLAWCETSGYEDGLTIDRIDPTKGYSPDNCRWVDWKGQARNRRNTKLDESKASQVKYLLESGHKPPVIARALDIPETTVNHIKFGFAWSEVEAKPFDISELDLSVRSHTNSILTDEQVRAIRAETGSQRSIAEKYGVSPSTVGAIRRRTVYKHIK